METIGEYAFYRTQKLKGNIIIPDATVSIGGFAFQGSAFDGTLTLGKGVQNIGQYAFADCDNVSGDLILFMILILQGV